MFILPAVDIKTRWCSFAYGLLSVLYCLYLALFDTYIITWPCLTSAKAAGCIMHRVEIFTGIPASTELFYYFLFININYRSMPGWYLLLTTNFELINDHFFGKSHNIQQLLVNLLHILCTPYDRWQNYANCWCS